MKRYAARRDKHEPDVIAALRAAGATSALGNLPANHGGPALSRHGVSTDSTLPEQQRASESMSKRRNKPLSVKVTRDGVLTIEIGLDTLACAALASPFAWELANEFAGDRGEQPDATRPDKLYRISNPRGFALEVRGALTDEREDGSSLLTDAVDAAIRKAYEEGSEFWVDRDHKESD